MAKGKSSSKHNVDHTYLLKHLGIAKCDLALAAHNGKVRRYHIYVSLEVLYIESDLDLA